MTRVMVVDDQEPVRMGLSLMLRRTDDLTVMLEPVDGQQAIDRLEQAESLGRKLPEVILMDVRMPVMDGIDATARITGRWPNVRVLILTTYDEDDYAFGGLSAGASGFLLKDVRARDLARAVRSVADGDAVLTPRVTRKVVERGVGRVERDEGRVERDEGALRLSAAFRELTPREREVCRLVADGLSNAEVAERICIEPASVKRSVTRILAKLGLRDRVQLAVSWYKAGMDGSG